MSAVPIRPAWLSLALLLTAGSTAGCWHVYSGSREPGCSQGINYIEAEYMGAHRRERLDAKRRATCESSQELVGFAPCDERPHPLVIYVPGTVQPHDHAFIMQTLERMAQKGYAAFSIGYDNFWPGQDCARYRARASCMFDPRREKSALSNLCALPQTDCSKGVVVMGHSQGGLIAILSADFAPDVRWVHAMGVTANPPGRIPDLDCVLPGTRKLPPEKLLVACGDCDVFFDGTRLNSCQARSPGVTRGLRELTGMRCQSRQHCIGRKGEGPRFGWIKIPGSRLRDREADHCYMFHQGCFGAPDEAWMTDPSLPLGLPALMDDIARVLSE
jgi:dienelactone hydrolase